MGGRRQEKQWSTKNNHLSMTVLPCVQGSDVLASDLWGYFTDFSFFLFFQTWKTSRRTEEALYQSVKVKEWFCCVAHRHILEVKPHTVTFIDCSTSKPTKWMRSYGLKHFQMFVCSLKLVFWTGAVQAGAVWVALFDLVISTLHLLLGNVQDFPVILRIWFLGVISLS